MIAAVAAGFAVYYSGISGFSGLVKTPVVELGDHLVFIDIFVKPAVGVGACVLGIVIREYGKAVLGFISCFPLGKQIFGLLLCRCLCFVGISAVIRGYGLYKYVADIDGFIVVVVAGNEIYGIITRIGFDNG